MRNFLLVQLLLLLAVAGVASASERPCVPVTVPVPVCSQVADVTELGCGITECVAYASAADWAEEVQVIFRLPAPPHGGPWLVDRVAFFMSGTEEHDVVIRTVRSGAPAEVLDESIVFAAGYSAWPPADWTYVALANMIPPYQSYLVLGGGDYISIGIRMKPDDCLGLASAGATEGEPWSFVDGQWEADEAMTPAVRIGLIDLGSSAVESQNWGSIKRLFR